MIEDLYHKMKSLFVRGQTTLATTESATIQLGDQVLTDVPVIHLAGLKTKPQIKQDMLLLVPAGELDHAVALNLASAHQDNIQVYHLLNELIKILADPANTAGDAMAANVKSKMTALLVQIQTVNPTSSASMPLDFLLKE